MPRVNFSKTFRQNGTIQSLQKYTMNQNVFKTVF